MTTSDSYTKDFPISWEELHRNGKALAWKLLNKGPLEGGKWKGIIAITRGGMVPSLYHGARIGSPQHRNFLYHQL